MAGNTGIILIVFLFCCLVASAIASAGGYYYYGNVFTTTSSTESELTPETSTDTTPTVTTPTVTKPIVDLAPLPGLDIKTIANYSAGTCQGSGAIFTNSTLGCYDSRAGIVGMSWKWATDQQSVACQKAAAGYIVTAVSANRPSLILKGKFMGNAVNSVGIKNMYPDWYTGNVTFTVMPIDAKGNNIMLQPIINTVTVATDGAKCVTVGVVPSDPVPYWNLNKNLIKLSHKSTGGAQGSFSAYAGDFKYFDDDYHSINTTHKFFVPIGSQFTAWCQSTGNDSCTRHRDYDWATVAAQAGPDMNSQVNMYGSCWFNCPSGFTPTKQT